MLSQVIWDNYFHTTKHGHIQRTNCRCMSVSLISIMLQQDTNHLWIGDLCQVTEVICKT